MKAVIVTPDKLIYEGEAVFVNLPGAEGELGILKNHTPILSLLKKGKVVVRGMDGKETECAISGGYAEVASNVVTVLADSVI